ncbi:S8 family serine peptidase [Streptomyces sp. NPDC058409]|uniref:S8 family serine peptidase n=1 Tax=Streptomyces sp. NPDC058409 TaxID=3346484 RepID=UPI00365FF851
MHHPHRGRTTRRLIATAVVIAVGASLPAITSAQAEAPATGLVQPATPAGKTSMVTLVTGDTVTVTTAPDGKESATLMAAEGTAKTFRTVSGPDGDLYVYPSDALDGISSGALDDKLFNVSQLVKDGYADGASDALPVILAYGDKPSAATLKQRADALPGSDRGAILDRLDMAGAKVDKSEAGAFWKKVKPVTKAQKSGKTVTAPGAAGVSKLWYDGKAKVSLDTSVPQIGAPEAWAKGYDGKGAKVAVLDTGIDASNADVKDNLTTSESFVPGLTAADGQGHGTHVASTIVGSGANSGGKYKGVAPGADLLVGKVLDNSGSGNASWIIEGMEWAVAQGADVVSMSLGGPTAGASDVMSQAVDQLSASSDSLFVIAAGNSGRSGESTIGSPGIADSALTVGAVDKSDALADFSSRGPRLVDSAIKPEITAPGVGIVAARAAGTAVGTPVNEFYTAASGTSMATPHVAGAAAILAQRHPDWTGERIKSVLTGHAKINTGQTVYQQGYGRVDIPAALDPALELSGSTDFGLVEWKQDGYEKETRKVTLSNTTGTDSTVTLSTQVSGSLPAGALALSAEQVTIPAGGSADVTLTLDPALVAEGQYSGRLMATAADGASVHSAIGFVKEPERFGLTIDLKDRLGNAPRRADFSVLGLDNSYYSMQNVSTGHLELRLPAGTYTLTGVVVTGSTDAAGSDYATDLFNVGEVDLTGQDASTTVDATKATDFDMRLPDESRTLEDSDMSHQLNRYNEDHTRRSSLGVAGLTNWSQERFGAVPSAAPATGELLASFYQSKREPMIRATVTKPETYTLAAKTSSYLKRFAGTRKFDVVDAGAGTAEEIAAADVKGKAAIVHVDRINATSVPYKALEAAGAEAIVIAPNNNGSQATVVTGVNVPYFSTTFADGKKLTKAVAQGRTVISLKGVEESGYTYAGQWDYADGIPASLRVTARAKDLATIEDAYHSDGADRMGYQTTNSWGSFPMTSVRSGQFLQQGHQRTDYVRAGNGLTYAQHVWARTDHPARMIETAKPYKAGTTTTEDWFGPAMHPANTSQYTCNFCRTDTGTYFMPQLGGDGDPDHSLASSRSRKWSYYRDGQPITDVNQLMVPEKAAYRFVDDNARAGNPVGVTLGTKTHTEYSFGSAAPTGMTLKDCKVSIPQATQCEALPVVLLDYGMKADILNKAAADADYAVTIEASRAKGSTLSSEMAGAKLSVSYDDGATWQPVVVKRKDPNTFRASFRHPELTATNGFVSLRTEVWDDAGNRTVQDITKAYALK